jgi:hypothetical protein
LCRIFCLKHLLMFCKICLLLNYILASCCTVYVTKADKGKTLVIITEEEYKQKIMEFIQDNNFIPSHKDPTQQYQSNIKQAIK